MKKREMGLFECLSEGFIWILGIFSVLALPFLWFQISFRFLFYIFCILSFLLMVGGGYILFKERGFNFRLNIRKDIVLISALILILIQMLCSAYLYHEDDDDGYYIAISNLAVEQDMVQTESRAVYDGKSVEGLQMGFQPPVVSWELFVASLAKLNNIHPAILAHSILPLFLIAISYLSIWRLGLILFIGSSQKKNSARFLFLYAVLNLFGGFLVRQPACFLLLRIWQGKAVLVNVVFPLLIENCLQIYKKNGQGSWLRGTVLLMAGIMLSPVGLTIAPLCYVSYGLPYLLFSFFKKRDIFWKDLRKAVMSMVPSMFFCVISYLYVMSQKSGYEYSLREPEPWMACLKNTLGTAGSGYLLFSVVALVCILKFGTQAEKLCLAGGTGIALLTFLNPLLSDVVGQKIIGVDVYWRAWWVIPVYAMIAVSFVYLLDIAVNMIFKMLVIFAAIGSIVWTGQFMYQDHLYFKGYQNAYKLPNDVLAVCDYILDRDEYVSILAPADISAKIRQYSTKLYVPVARGMPGSSVVIPDTDLTYGQVYEAVYDDNEIDEAARMALRKMDITYLISREKVIGSNYIGKCGEMYVCKVDGA